MVNLEPGTYDLRLQADEVRPALPVQWLTRQPGVQADASGNIPVPGVKLAQIVTSNLDFGAGVTVKSVVSHATTELAVQWTSHLTRFSESAM
jgi:hypothetical protein